MEDNKERILEDISDIFSIFHDGTISKWELSDNQLRLAISCLYLAKIISIDFEYFYLELNEVKRFELIPWTLPNQKKEIINDLNEISKCDFEIINAKTLQDVVKISCHEHNQIFSAPGSDLFISAQNILVKGHDGRVINLDSLKSIKKQYWSNSLKRDS